MYRDAVRATLVGAATLLLFANVTAAISGELLGQCPAQSAPCPERAETCSSDRECGADQRCCAVSCGSVCVEPLYTGCENVRVAAERVARALAAEAGGRSGRRAASGIRTPRCRAADGEFEPVQCDNEIVSSCWCVDAAGFEIAGTRAPAAGLVNCSAQAACAAHTCRMLCPLGFQLDARGCPLCRCRDPCAGVACPSALSCQLEETPCLRPPCPPVPSCKRGRSLQNICPAGEPLLIPETHRPFLCGTDPGKPNCPPLHKCLVESGNDYGVCCPASLEFQKAGTCPAEDDQDDYEECGTPCAHDLECPSVQKCCDGQSCGRHCVMPRNVTECLQQKHLAELLSVSEREGKGYVPQCTPEGKFESRQCSRNGLVCWCVDKEGHKLQGSMGPAEGVKCSDKVLSARASGRAMAAARCGRALCATVCEYGYKTGADDCPTCECDDPCDGFPCAEGEECVRVKDSDCTGEFCAGYPVCRPRISYENPCAEGAPLTNATTGEVVSCAQQRDCPAGHECAGLEHAQHAFCCPVPLQEEQSQDKVETMACPLSADALCGLNGTASCGSGGACAAGLRCCSTDTCGDICLDPIKHDLQDHDSTPTMCEYLRDFDDKMEGTVDGMRLALPAPACHRNGSFVETQCAGAECWCVDSFGTEIPRTRGEGAPAADCLQLRTDISCLELTCRMGCDYGFELSNTTRCPACRCRHPCAGVRCPAGRACAAVDVACDGDYCPPVPACLPRKTGQCPYLVPTGGSCEFSCRADAECGEGERCCATGCGTACAPVVLQSACQQRRAHALHHATERGAPPSSLSIPACTPDGAFERVQCRATDAICWCVDQSGAEIAGTRVRDGATPDCDKPAVCPPPSCDAVAICEHGPVLDASGCPTCECSDPCSDLLCAAEETCKLVTVECTGEPCPRLAVCVPAPACPGGAMPLVGPDGSTPLVCGPSAAACPSSHSCRFEPHDQSSPVCCAKPRTVCFERKEEGWCPPDASGPRALNVTRWYFNRDRNRCEKFRYGGCSTSHNNFHTLEACNTVCPVLSRCERLREKNALAAQRYGQPTFTPACSDSGEWEPVQCMHHIDVCWCVSGLGDPQKGSLVRGARPDCNFRRARTQLHNNNTQSDEVLEELIRQMTALRLSEFEQEDEYMESTGNQDIEEADEEIEDGEEEGQATEEEQVVSAPPKKMPIKSKCLAIQEKQTEKDKTTVQCQPNGSFSPKQCSGTTCWCVDEAGNKIQHVDNLPENDSDICEHTRVESVQVEMGILSDLAPAEAERARAALAARLVALGARVPVSLERLPNAVTLRFTLRQHNKVDLVYHLENLVKEERARVEASEGTSERDRLMVDVVRADYRLVTHPTPAMQHREILSESTVSVATSYHTALIVLAATSAFIISVLSVLLMLYRVKLARREPPKVEERFLPYAPPVYVLSADEKADLARVLHSTEPSDIPKV